MELNINNRSTLYKLAEEVAEDEDVTKIITAMYKTILNSPIKAIGLAAPQIGASKRIILICTPGINQIIINPVITRRRSGRVPSREGCLSFPGKMVKIQRYKLITVEGKTPVGTAIKMKLRGLDAFVVQHEIDHLNGITIVKDKK